jgi:FkbM family methyltransferase
MNGEELATVKFNGLEWETYLSSFNEIREIFWWEVYDQGKCAIEKGDVVADIGANVGTFSLKALQHEAKIVIPFEPHPDSFQRLLKNLDRNYDTSTLEDAGARSHRRVRRPALLCFDVALANKKGTGKLFKGFAPGGHSLLVSGPEHIDVRISTLDSCLEEVAQFTNRIDMIKMDVEGAAHLVLEGAKKVLAQDHLKIGAAVYHHAPERVGVLKMLKEYGLEYKGYDAAGNPEDIEDKFKFVQGWK